MVITCDTLNLLLVPSALVINSMCSLVITITTRDIFQYLKANRSALTLHILLLDSILQQTNLISQKKKKLGIGFCYQQQKSMPKALDFVTSNKIQCLNYRICVDFTEYSIIQALDFVTSNKIQCLNFLCEINVQALDFSTSNKINANLHYKMRTYHGQYIKSNDKICNGIYPETPIVIIKIEIKMVM